jgi:hypothetical protein
MLDPTNPNIVIRPSIITSSRVTGRKTIKDLHMGTTSQTTVLGIKAIFIIKPVDLGIIMGETRQTGTTTITIIISLVVVMEATKEVATTAITVAMEAIVAAETTILSETMKGGNSISSTIPTCLTGETITRIIALVTTEVDLIVVGREVPTMCKTPSAIMTDKSDNEIITLTGDSKSVVQKQ